MKSSISRFGTRSCGYVLSAALAGAVLSPVGIAQEQQLQLEEILVTARKREESIQDVPVSVTSISRELNEATLRRLDDIQSFTPNVYIRNTAGTPGGAAISIRGVSYQEIDKSLDPSIGVIMEGMYLGTSSGSLLQNFDIGRVEVLRGPQGTLFGKNTIGGVINVIRSPVTMDWGLDAIVTIGEDDRNDYKLVANMPIIEDTLGVKLFGMDLNSDGYIENTTFGDDVGGDDYTTYGLATRWTPSENFAVQLHYEHEKNETDAGTWANFNQADDLVCILGANPAFPFWGAAQGCQAFDTGSDEDHNSTNRRNDNDTEIDSTILTIDWDLDGFLLTSITAYREQDENNWSEFDASAATFLSLDYYNDYDQFSQELRLASNFSDKFEFVGGLYYWESEYEQYWNTHDLFYVLDLIGQIVPGVPGGAGFPPNILGYNTQNQETTSYAAFFSGDYFLTDKWTLTAGLRWTYEEKDFEGSNASFYVDGTPRPNPELNEFDDDWDEVSPKLGVQYQLNDDVMFFGSYSEGFKSGGFFGRQASFDGIEPSYDPETVENWELGMKGTFMDGRLLFNPSIFYSDYSDKQEEILLFIDAGNVATIVRNASTLEIMGAELEAQFQISEAWFVRANYGYLDAEYDDFVSDLNGDGIETDNSDLTPRNTPENTFGLSTTYTLPLGPGEVVGYAAYRWRDEIEVIANNDELGHLDDIENLDLTLNYIWNDGRYRVTAYGRNITDEREAIVTRIPGLVAFGQYNQGENYGVEFAVSF